MQHRYVWPKIDHFGPISATFVESLSTYRPLSTPNVPFVVGFRVVIIGLLVVRLVVVRLVVMIGLRVVVLLVVRLVVVGFGVVVVVVVVDVVVVLVVVGGSVVVGFLFLFFFPACFFSRSFRFLSRSAAAAAFSALFMIYPIVLAEHLVLIVYT